MNMENKLRQQTENDEAAFLTKILTSVTDNINSLTAAVNDIKVELVCNKTKLNYTVSDIEKINAIIEKLKTDINTLKMYHTNRYTWLDLLKAVPAIVAIISALVALLLSYLKQQI